MTNEEIIAILESYKNYEDNRTEDLLHHGYDNTKEATKRKEALDEAIKAISENKGEWIYDGDCIHCSSCKSAFNNLIGFNFCPNCGADMREGE